MKSHASLLFVSVLGLSLVGLTGCGQDEIRSYIAPRESRGAASPPMRLLAVMLPAGQDTWFIKLVGRQDIVDAVEPAWKELLDSLTIDPKADVPLRWKVPANWKEDRKKAMRVATLTPEGVGRPEIVISRLGAEANVLKPNVDRWRKNDLQLGPISEEELAKVTSKRKLGDFEMTLIDLRKEGSQPEGDLPPPTRPDTGKRKGPLTYQVPAGWKDSGPQGIAAGVLSVTEGGQTATLKITPISGSMTGGLLANVNRWRGEVGLPPVEEKDLASLPTRKIRVGADQATGLDLSGPKGRSLVVWFERDGSTWFFKFNGPTELIDRQRDAFEKLLLSVAF
jgi:hypothetical protein